MRILLIGLVILMSYSSYSQNKLDRFSINPKIGAQIDISSSLGFSYGLALKLFSQKNIWSSQYLFTSGANLFGSNHPKDKRNEFVGWIGRYFGERYLRIECLFGIGLVWGEKKGEKTYHAVHAYQYEVIPYTTVGIPLQLGFKFLPTKSISLGFDMHVNLNLDESFFSLLFSVECGMLRNEIDKRPLE